MLRKQSVCVSCGRFKRRALIRCKRCGYLPSSDYEIARAVILSRQMQAGATVIGRSPSELKRIAAEIRGGRPYLFDPDEEQIALYAYRHAHDAAGKIRRNIVVAISIAVLILVIAILALLSG
jgi:hypothetical protein